VSLNLWGFTPPVFGRLRERFERFLKERGADPRAEFYLPDALGGLIARGEARVRLLSTPDPWFGMTHRRDAEEVRTRLMTLHAQGAYPPSLFPA
jgi:hypothetical protein